MCNCNPARNYVCDSCWKAKRDTAIDEVFKRLSALTPQELQARLEGRELGWVGRFLLESNALVVNRASVPKLPEKVLCVVGRPDGTQAINPYGEAINQLIDYLEHRDGLKENEGMA